MVSSQLEVRLADLTKSADARAVEALLDSYSCSEFGDRRHLPEEKRRTLVSKLAAFPTTRIFLAWLEGEPVGVAICFLGFSTFKGTPLLNVHDLAVLPSKQGLGAGRKLLQFACDFAKQEGLCKVTLEVRSDNFRAASLYRSLGFSESAGFAHHSIFMTKVLE